MGGGLIRGRHGGRGRRNAFQRGAGHRRCRRLGSGCLLRSCGCLWSGSRGGNGCGCGRWGFRGGCAAVATGKRNARGNRKKEVEYFHSIYRFRRIHDPALFAPGRGNGFVEGQKNTRFRKMRGFSTRPSFPHPHPRIRQSPDCSVECAILRSENCFPIPIMNLSKQPATKVLRTSKENNRRRLERLLREIRAVEAETAGNASRRYLGLYRRVIE